MDTERATSDSRDFSGEGVSATIKPQNILVACEESQAVCRAFREKGQRAFSCDIEPCSGGFPEWHVQGDVLSLLDGNCTFITTDRKQHSISGNWDIILGFPPCTYLTSAGTRHFSPNCNPPEKIKERQRLREQATAFFLALYHANCEKVAIAPQGVLSCLWQFTLRTQ